MNIQEGVMNFKTTKSEKLALINRSKTQAVCFSCIINLHY